MKLREKLELIRQSNLYKLNYNGKTMGLRVKLYNSSNDVFDYYDFVLGTVSNNIGVRDFINSIQANLPILELKEHNSLLVTDEELTNSIVVKEFKDESKAIAVLSQFKLIYEFNKEVA